MTRIAKKKIKLSFAVFLAILGAIACALSVLDGGYVTFAWFTANRTASVDVASLVVTSLDTVSSVVAYPYHTLSASEGNAAEGVSTFEKTATQTNSMGKFSILAPNGKGLLLEITLTPYAQSASSIQVTAHTEATAYLGELDTSGHLKKALALTGNSLSSIVCFYAFAASAVVDQGAYYSVATASTANSTGAKMTFVSNAALAKNVSMCSLRGPVPKFYIVLDYDVSLIESIYSANIGNEVIADATNVGADGQSYLSYAQDFYFKVDAAASSATSSGASSL